MAERSGAGKIVGLVLGGLGAVALLGCCITCGVAGYFGNQQVEQQRAALAALDGVCRGVGAAGAAELGAAPGVHAQLYSDGGQLEPYALPAEMRSTAVADTQRVVCRGELERYDLEECDYETGLVTGITGGRNVIRRVAYRQSWRIVAARTGQPIAAQLFEGAPPDPCPAEADFDDGGDTQTRYGREPDTAQIHAWIAAVSSAGPR